MLDVNSRFEEVEWDGVRHVVKTYLRNFDILTEIGQIAGLMRRKLFAEAQQQAQQVLAKIALHNLQFNPAKFAYDIVENYAILCNSYRCIGWPSHHFMAGLFDDIRFCLEGVEPVAVLAEIIDKLTVLSVDHAIIILEPEETEDVDDDEPTPYRRLRRDPE